MKRNEDSLRDLWDNIKCNNIHIIGVPEGEEREKGQAAVGDKHTTGERGRDYSRKLP